jgi:hypothetical protein
MENIRSGARGLDDLTNYVVAITNTWTLYTLNGTALPPKVNGYTYAGFVVDPPYPTATVPSAGSPITDGMIIVGLLSTPEFIDNSGRPISYPQFLAKGGYSNYVVAYVRSLSGPAVEKPPQDNDIIRSDSFSYKMICQNVPAPTYTPPLWKGGRYSAGTYVSFFVPGQINMTYWRAIAQTPVADLGPTRSALWVQDAYPTQLAVNLRELRLTFLWPLLQNGSTGNGRHTFRTSVGGQLVQTNDNNGQWLYFFQPQSFVSAP